MTDVNIAVSMISDAAQGAMDKALLISGDSDLVPAVRTLGSLWPAIQVVVAFPPKRHTSELALAANASFMIGRGKLAASQFPAQAVTASGHIVQRPAKWS
jgi:hypothetical protein